MGIELVMAFRGQAKIFAGATTLKFYSLCTSHGKSVLSPMFMLISTG